MEGWEDWTKENTPPIGSLYTFTKQSNTYVVVHVHVRYNCFTTTSPYHIRYSECRASFESGSLMAGEVITPHDPVANCGGRLGRPARSGIPSSAYFLRGQRPRLHLPRRWR